MNRIVRRSLASFLALATGAALLVAGPARAATASPIVVPLAGSAGGIALSGQATLETSLVTDELGGAASVLVAVHVNNLSGEGIAASGEAVLVRPLASSDTVEVVLSVAGSDATATATFALRLDPATGAALGADATLQ